MIYDGDNSNDDAEMELVMRMVVRMEIEMGMGMGMGMELRLRIITMMILKGILGFLGMMLMAMMMLWRHQMRVQQRHLDCRCYSAHIKAQGSEYIWKIDQFAAYCASLPSVGPPKRKNGVLHITWAQVASCQLQVASCELQLQLLPLPSR